MRPAAIASRRSRLDDVPSTPLVRRGEPIAWIDHDSVVGDAVEPALTPAVRLSIDNARLRVELLARMGDLRDARRRIVGDGDDERRRLERDLHDGAQQRLLALAASLRSGATQARATRNGSATILDGAVDETAAVLEEVRVLAHGIYPAVLTDAGLGPAVASLADVAGLPVQILRAPGGRYAPTIEAAAYRVVAESIDNAVAYSDATLVTVEIDEADGALALDVHDDGHGGAEVQASRWPRRTRRPSRRARRRALRRKLSERYHDQRGDPVRVVIADDAMLTREGIVRLLAEAGVEVVGQAEDADELIRQVSATRPDAAIVDIRMPPTHTDEGLVAAQRIRTEFPDVGVLVLSQYVEPSYAMRLLEEHPEKASATCSRSASSTSPSSSTR